MKLAVAFAAILGPASQALAFGEGAVCDKAALNAADAHGVPPQVMLAITRVETGRSRKGTLQPWPWAVNQDGQSHWFETAGEAETFISGAVDAGLSNIDIGCFQLNLHWHGESFKSLKDMLDPWQNADYAARFLVENHRRKGNWVDAVAAYHSQTQANAKVYVEKVERVLGLLQAAPIENDPDSTPMSPPRENRFPLLQPGEGMALASLVPSGPPLTPLLGPTPLNAETP